MLEAKFGDDPLAKAISSCYCSTKGHRKHLKKLLRLLPKRNFSNAKL